MDALGIAERSGNDMALAFARVALGTALVQRRTTAERDRGQTFLAEVSDVFTRHAHNLGDRPLVDVLVARGMARRGDRDEAIQRMRASTDRLITEGQLLGWGVPATGFLVETLLERGAEGDVAEADAAPAAGARRPPPSMPAIERLRAAPVDADLAIRDIWLLRLRALLARAHGDEAGYRDYRDRYRDKARTLGFEGHIGWAAAMP
ncbi:hypothetical protein [Mycolicibacterium chubuense]|uniref:hypothetical protein n=1 Tax=Mycolicibacterium chubuense TaxID=1800 RepID=UPI00030A899E|nr:hypothetical protein [Mycolicibacterium chubuense]